MSTPPPVPVTIVSEIPEWVTAIVVPVGAAVLAALIVLAGFAIDARQRNRQRRATFVDELCQLLVVSATTAAREDLDGKALAREQMIANQLRVRAAAQMKPREYRIYAYASTRATSVVNGEEPAPQQATALAITALLQWLNKESRTRDFPKPAASKPVRPL